MNIAYIALGSNITPRDNYLKQAVQSLQQTDHIDVINESHIYETEPVGYMDQGNFLNMVVEIKTSLKPLELLNCCQLIEEHLGRKREIRWGPRTIDLDILLYNQENIITEQLIVPHPRMHERAFVLIPLKDVSPTVNVPILNKTVTAILAETPIDEKRGVIEWVPSNGEDE